MPHWIRTITGFVVVAASSCSTAWAFDFTINVPVSLNHMPNVTALTVYCDVKAGGPGGSTVGSGSHRVQLSGPDYSAVVPVAFDALTTHPPGSATYYSCYLGLEGKSTKGAGFESSYMMLASDWLGATGQTLTINPSNPSAVSGPLPVKK